MVIDRKRRDHLSEDYDLGLGEALTQMMDETGVQCGSKEWGNGHWFGGDIDWTRLGH